MTHSPQFQAAVSCARPAGTRVIEAYSLKLGRRLQCFGEAAFEQWIRLEADPSVEVFCERPLCLNLADGKLLVDFWVRQGDREMLIIVDDGRGAVPAIADVDIEVRVIPPADRAATRIWTDNWQRMLPVITSCRRDVSASLMQAVQKFVSEPMQLSRIEQEFVTDDPTPVRAAVFCLLHGGRLEAPQLRSEELSYLTVIHPAVSAQVRVPQPARKLGQPARTLP